MAGDTSRLNGRLGGRPQGSENEGTKTRRAMRQRWLDRVNQNADCIFNAHLDLALGAYFEERGSDGRKRV